MEKYKVLVVDKDFNLRGGEVEVKDEVDASIAAAVIAMRAEADGAGYVGAIVMKDGIVLAKPDLDNLIGMIRERLKKEAEEVKNEKGD